MVGGQYIDVRGMADSGDTELRRLHELKTGRLIRASVECVLLLRERVQVLRAVDAVEDFHVVRVAMKSVICSSSAAPEPAVARSSAACALPCDSAAIARAPSSPYRVT